jgi:hypothetical protein
MIAFPTWMPMRNLSQDSWVPGQGTWGSVDRMKISWSCPCAFLTKHHAVKAYRRSGGIAPRIFDLGTRWRWVVSFTPRLLYSHGKSPWYPLSRRVGEPQNRSGRGGEEKNSQPLQRLEPPINEPIAQLCITELSRLLSGHGVTEKFPASAGN